MNLLGGLSSTTTLLDILPVPVMVIDAKKFTFTFMMLCKLFEIAHVDLAVFLEFFSISSIMRLGLGALSCQG